MAFIEDALSRKMRQQPQFDYLWRVVLPNFDIPLDSTSTRSAEKYRETRAEQAVGWVKDRLTKSILDLDRAVMNATNSVIVEAGGKPMAQQYLDSAEISHRVYEISTPYRSFSSENGIYLSANKKYAAHRDVGNLSITIDEMEDGLTLAYLEYWMSLIENPDGTRNPPNVYKHPIKFIRMSATKLDLSATQYMGCWPVEIAPTANSYDGSGITQYNVTFAVDSLEYILAEGVIDRIIAADNDILAKDYRSELFDASRLTTEEKQSLLDKAFDWIF